MKPLTELDAEVTLNRLADCDFLTPKFKNACRIGAETLAAHIAQKHPQMLSLEELLDYDGPVYLWFVDNPGIWVVRPKGKSGWIDTCAPERMSLFNMKWYLHSRYGIDWKAFPCKPEDSDISAVQKKCCNTCQCFAELKKPYIRSDGATIYGYCFSKGDTNYSPDMGKGLPVFVDGGGCSCKKYKPIY